MRWRDAPAEYDLPKTIYSRFIRWSQGVFKNILRDWRQKGGKPDS